MQIKTSSRLVINCRKFFYKSARVKASLAMQRAYKRVKDAEWVSHVQDLLLLVSQRE